MLTIGGGWDELLKTDFESEYYLKLREFLKSEYNTHVVYPSMYDIFNALKLTPFDKVKAVILGQDPYHGYNQAHGLCFSVKDGVEPPPSLVNIFKELHSDVGFTIPNGGNLTKWANNGVLLLNTVLTVRENAANSHKGKGWEQLTDSIIEKISNRGKPTVFLLWGANARSKKAIINTNGNLILECAHPSPLSAYNGFFGCKHFSKTNKFLVEHGEEPINWELV